jgi:uncharacterized protein YjeT (DUF2065 family)
MRVRIAWILGLLSAVNGISMLLAPAAWYASIPGVQTTGPFNHHFVRDIGSAYLVAGAGLIWFALDYRARPAALAAAFFFALHALVHLADAVAGRESVEHALADIPAIYLSAALALWVALPHSS